MSGADSNVEVSNNGNRSALIKLLRLLSRVLPGDYLKTFFYLNIIEKPRRFLRLSLNAFYRIEHVYAVLREFRQEYLGGFSVLEFGTSDGYAFTKMLYATKYLHLQDRVMVHTFDSFEGMPAAVDEKDLDIVTGDSWTEGQFKGRFEQLNAYCSAKYPNYRIHKGYFQDTLIPEFLDSLKAQPPILVWFDCDYYSSARIVFERLLPYLPNGCVLYFDEYEQLNFGSRFTGEARLVHEINHGVYGEDIELVLDTTLSLNSKRIYRFMRLGSDVQYTPAARENAPNLVHWRSNDSAMP